MHSKEYGIVMLHQKSFKSNSIVEGTPEHIYQTNRALVAGDPAVSITYTMPITVPIVSAKASSSGGYMGGQDGYGKTSGTHVVETKVEATYTTVVGMQPADQAPAAMPYYKAPA